MKKIIFVIVVIIAFATTAFASEVYFGAFLDSHTAAQPAWTTNAKYVAGVSLDKTINRFTPFLNIETLMDDTNDNGSFNPASVRYTVGVSTDIYQGIKIDVSRQCWHPTDENSIVDEYYLIKARYVF